MVELLTNKEFENTKIRLIKIIPATISFNELKSQQRGYLKASEFLGPFLDEQNAIQVGGRVSNLNLSYDPKFPILLHTNHKLTMIIMKSSDCKYLPVDAQACFYFIRQKFVILAGRNIPKK